MTSGVKTILIGALILGITMLEYLTRVNAYRHHIFYQGLYFLPIIMAGFWFGLGAALFSCGTIILLYLPFVFISWRSFSGYDFNNLMDVVLYVVVAGFIGSLRDREIAQQNRAREAERLAAVGRALSALAHDLKTPLIAIAGYGRLVQKKMGPENPLQNWMGIIVAESRRLEGMMTGVLDFAKPLNLNLAHGDIRGTASRVVAVTEEIARQKNVSIRIESPSHLPAFPFDECRLEQALLNLVKNAVEASPQGEIVRLYLHSRGPHIVIDVTDCGDGIPLKIRNEIFEPFHTTKEEGTGLGLPIARKIIEAHGGHIEVIYNPKGTTFRIVLPKD